MRSLVFLLLVPTTILAQDLSSFEKVLVPVLSSTTLRGPGVDYRTPVIASTDSPVHFYPASAEGAPVIGVLPAGIRNLPYFESTPRSDGRLLYFERDDASQLSLSAQLQITTDAGTHKTALPVVRESQFLLGKRRFAFVDMSPHFVRDQVPPRIDGITARTRLRIYDVDTTGRLHATVRILPEPVVTNGQLVVKTYEVDVNRRDGDDPSYPDYADISLDDVVCTNWPDPANCQPFTYAIEIEPSDPAIHYWTLASTTENATGETRLMYPQ